MTKSHLAAGAEVDLLIGELELEFDLLRLRNLRAGLERKDERLAQKAEKLRRDGIRKSDATTAKSSGAFADDGAGKRGWWRVLTARVAVRRRVWWIGIRRKMLVEEWRRLSLLEGEIEFAMRVRGLRIPR